MALPIFFFAVAVLVVFVVMPLLQPSAPLVETGDDARRRVAALEQEKVSYLRALKDIEFERATGKIDEDDYEDLKGFYTRKAAEALEALDRLAGKRGGAT